MVYLVKKPLSNAFKAKREAIRAELIKAEEEKQAALAQLTSAEAKLVNLETEKASVVEKARREAEEEKARIAEQTSNEISKMRNQADSEIERISKQTKLAIEKILSRRKRASGGRENQSQNERTNRFAVNQIEHSINRRTELK